MENKISIKNQIEVGLSTGIFQPQRVCLKGVFGIRENIFQENK